MKRHISFLYVHWATWLGSFLLLAILPITSRSGSLAPAVGLSLFYVLWSSFWAFVFGCKLKGAPAGPVAIAPDHKHVSRFLWRAAVVGVIGVSFLIYDRVTVQGIGFSSGIALARAAWANAGMERSGGVSSVFSVAGNILWAFAYVVLAPVVLVWERLRVFERVVLLILAGGTIIATSALNGGRTPIVLGLGIFISVCLVRSIVGLAFFPPLLVKARKMRVLVALCILAYFPYISVERSEMTQIDPHTYATIMLTFAHGQWTDSIHVLDSLPDSVEAGVYPVLLSGIQWVHPFLVLETVIEVPDRSGAVLLGTMISIAEKIGIVHDVPVEWTYPGLFLSLPGGLYHDLGFLGVLLGGLVHGAFLGRCESLLRRRRVGLPLLCVCIAVLSETILAPLINADALAPFPFMIFAFMVAAPFCRPLVAPGKVPLAAIRTITVTC
jgi:hypothetical protein